MERVESAEEGCGETGAALEIGFSLLKWQWCTIVSSL